MEGGQSHDDSPVKAGGWVSASSQAGRPRPPVRSASPLDPRRLPQVFVRGCGNLAPPSTTSSSSSSSTFILLPLLHTLARPGMDTATSVLRSEARGSKGGQPPCARAGKLVDVRTQDNSASLRVSIGELTSLSGLFGAARRSP